MFPFVFPRHTWTWSPVTLRCLRQTLNTRPCHTPPPPLRHVHPVPGTILFWRPSSTEMWMCSLFLPFRWLEKPLLIKQWNFISEMLWMVSHSRQDSNGWTNFLQFNRKRIYLFLYFYWMNVDKILGFSGKRCSFLQEMWLLKCSNEIRHERLDVDIDSKILLLNEGTGFLFINQI